MGLGIKDCKKIEQTKEAKKKYTEKSPLIELLFGTGWKTKEELSEKLYCSDRALRNLISELSMHYPVCFDTKGEHAGYYLPKKIEDCTQEQLKYDLSIVEQTLGDLMARVEVLNKRMKPLIAYREVAKKYVNE